MQVKRDRHIKTAAEIESETQTDRQTGQETGSERNTDRKIDKERETERQYTCLSVGEYAGVVSLKGVLQDPLPQAPVDHLLTYTHTHTEERYFNYSTWYPPEQPEPPQQDVLLLLIKRLAR